MATKTQAEIAVDVLRHLGVLDAGQSATAEDSDIATKAITSVYNRLRREGLAPYALTAVPEWAQDLLRNTVCPTLCKDFGITGQDKVDYEMEAMAAKMDMGSQTSGKYDPRVVTTFKDY